MVLFITLLAIALLAGLSAYWTWVWVAAPLASPAPASIQMDSRMDAANDLFGITPSSEKGMTASAAGPIKLFGIIAAAKGHSAYVLLQLNASEMLVLREGENVFSGVRLTEIANDHIVLERNGIRESLTWAEKPVVKN